MGEGEPDISEEYNSKFSKNSYLKKHHCIHKCEKVTYIQYLRKCYKKNKKN